MGKSPVLGAAFGIFAVWWTASFIAYIVTGKVWTDGVWVEPSLRAWGGLFTGALVGAAIMSALVMLARHWKLASMTGDDVRGVHCSIGQLPMHIVLPPSADKFPDKGQLVFPPKDFDKHGKLNVDWMDEWFVRYERDYPDHAKLMRAVARILNKTPSFPAAAKKNYRGEPFSAWGDDRYHHGGLTLLAHSWLAGSVGVWKSVHGFSYTGIKNAIEDNQNIKLNDPNYVFQDFDPLIGLICFIHDIGKIVTFEPVVTKAKGEDEVTYVQTRPRSDTIGAALVAKMEEFWALPYEDRMIITLTVGNYRKPSNMPLRRDINNPNQAIALSDRTMAMLKLITEVDDEVSAIERNTEPEPPSLDRRQGAPATYEEDLWETFRGLLNESFRIHHENHKFRVGQKNTMPTGVVVTLKEDVLRGELATRMLARRHNHPTEQPLEGVAFTKCLLKVLEAKQCLITEVVGLKVPAESAVWKVEFHGKDKAKQGEVIATWPYAIMINPEVHFPRMSNDQDASSAPNVVGPANLDRMTEARAPRAPAYVDALVQGPLEDEEGIPILAPGPAKGAKGGKGPGRKGGAPVAAGAEQSATSSPGLARPTKPQERPAAPPASAAPAAPTPLEDEDDFPEMPVEAPVRQPRGPADGAVAVAVSSPIPAPNVVPFRRPAAAAEGSEGDESEQAAEGGQGATQALPPSSSGSFLDEVDPQEDGSPEPPADVQTTEEVPDLAPVPAPAHVGSEEPREPELAATPESPAAPPAKPADKAHLLDGLRDRLRRDAMAAPGSRGAAPAPTQSQPERAPSPAVAELPPEAIEVARILAKRLEWLEYLRSQKKIAADTLEDGRLAYSFEAIKAHDQKMDWLPEEVLRLLLAAKKAGPTAPVCYMRTRGGVSLIVVNPQMVAEING